MSIQHEHTLHPITALEFYRDQAGIRYVLAGEGSYLKIFEAQTSRLVCCSEIFEGQTIHGIAVRENITVGNGLQVALWGGSSLALIGRRDFQQLLEGDVSKFSSAICAISDWALDAVISPHEDDSCIIVTAHNTLIQANLASNSLSISIEEFESPSRSILYSANLVWESDGQILVAAGTVFGEIIVWQFSIPRNEIRGEGRVLFTFTGHEGSIFGVNISPPITHPDKTVGRILASCSDDRTIRIWDISVRSEKEILSRNHASPRETGFGSNGESTQSTCMAMAMGHASRIWRVKILTDGLEPTKPTQVNVLSFGEDSTTQQWSLRTRATEEDRKSLNDNGISPKSQQGWSSQLVHTDTCAFHEGKHIWSAATYALEGDRTCLVTGGADGKIACHEIKISRAALAFSKGLNHSTGASTDEDTPKSSWDLEEVLRSLPPGNITPVSSELPSFEEPVDEVLDLENSEKKKKKKVKKIPKDAFNRYAFVSENTVLVTTNFGRIILGHIQETVKWEGILLPESNQDDLRSYAVVEGIPEIGQVYLAGSNGNIFAYFGGTTLLLVGKVEGKVAEMFKIFDSQKSCYELLVTTLNGTSAMLFSFNSADSTSFASSLSFELPERFIVTSAAKINGRVILGSRVGTLAVYDVGNGAASLHISQKDDNLAGDAITTILSLPGKTSTTQDDKSFYFLTTSRKGIYAIYACNLAVDRSTRATEARICQVHHSTPPFSSMVEHAWSAANQIFQYGFKGKNFAVWNETQQYEIMSVECGGAHRSYAYSPTSEGGHFIYTKASKLYLHSQLLPSSKTIKRGGHGREIKTCAVSDDRSFIATGAEDTTIRIWRYDDVNDKGGSQLSHHKYHTESELTCLAVIQKHTTGIQHLSWHGSKYLFSSGGTEEFFVWAVEEVPGFGIGVVCEATCPDKSEDRDLRIMSFDVSELGKPATSTDKESDGGETRGEALLLISLAYSDSTIRTYTYSKAAGFSLLATGRYTSSCLMQIRHVHISKEDGEVYVVTAATDGNLALWKGSLAPSLSSQSQPQSKLEQHEEQQLSLLSTRKVHQNSIKALDIAASTSASASKSHQILLATGGDDNALGISLYDLSNSKTAPKSFIIRSAHAAAITGLCFVSDSEHGSELETKIVTEAQVERETETETETETEQSVRIVTSSNDQKVKEWDVRIKRGREGNIETHSEATLQVKLVGDVFTPVADVGDLAPLRGVEAAEGAKRVLVVGNGMEVWNVSSS